MAEHDDDLEARAKRLCLRSIEIKDKSDKAFTAYDINVLIRLLWNRGWQPPAAGAALNRGII
jgi:hypothetical protein